MVRTAVTLSLCLLLASCMRAELRRTAEMSIGDVSIASIPNGTYTGSHTFGGFTYSVRATILDGRAEKIKVLNNKTTMWAKKAEPIVQQVVAQQKLDIDAISGATATSKALLKACEKALSKGASKANE